MYVCMCASRDLQVGPELGAGESIAVAEQAEVGGLHGQAQRNPILH